MAIYHFSAKVISRALGSSAVAAAAYRSAHRLYDERLGRSHDFSSKAGVVHSEILLPENAPEKWRDRERLWNDVEAAELRKDAQLAREIEFAIPREMTQEQGVALVRDFVQREFVERGMIADLNVHWDIGAEGLAKPHAHVMLTMREISVGEDGSVEFGAKVRNWNRTELLSHWREAWAEHVNERLAALDIDARVDHRTLEEQGIDLEPQHKIGPAASRMAAQGLEADRYVEHLEIARSNGAKIIGNPSIALNAITHRQSTFTNRDLAIFVHRHSDGREQFDAVMSAVKTSPNLVALGKDGRGEDRFTSRFMIETERRLERATAILDARRNHSVADRHRELALARAYGRGLDLSAEQRGALEYVTSSRGISNVIGYAGTGKSAMLGVARDSWEAEGYQVQGAALSGIAAEGLEQGSGIASRTLASLEHQWANDRDRLTEKHILVIDEAGMVGTRQLQRVVSEAERQGAKIVLVGDPEQLQAIEAGAAFRAAAERHGAIEITTIRRQEVEWQRDATRELATGRTGEAIGRYADGGHVHAADTRDAARSALIDAWDRDRQRHPDASRIILTHTNDEVGLLNGTARERMRASGALGSDIRINAERGARHFAPGDRIMFLKNERGLGVRNGSLGTVQAVNALRMGVMLDDGRNVAFDLKDYAQVDHGYAATIHKAQGITVDRVQVLATPGVDSHSTYVALSRHREQVDLYYGRDDFTNQKKFVRTASRERGKDMASDYRDSSRAIAVARPAQQPKRDIFAGLQLRRPAGLVEQVKIVPDPPRRGRFDGLRINAHAVERTPPSDPIDRAVQRYGRAAQDIVAMRDKGLKPLLHQNDAMATAAHELDAVRPDGVRDLGAAMAKNPALIPETASGRTLRAVQAMRAERTLRIDTQARADRFVTEWQRGMKQLQQHKRAHDHVGAERVGKALGDMAKSLHRDPQLESLLQNRRIQLGLDAMSKKPLSHDLHQWLSPSRSRGLGR
ncbi:conjugal transfer protein TraA [Sphingopyxis sp. Root214]|uniref:Ti-type conjugative transfer relaxase TraA n=1 Tax=unclassified Sphingopyxis TaxID=2614943 RepID=UPI0006F2A1CC|nr:MULTISPECIES: Ti-type conjugative transfer relaxase TraA [unclassified Sphingopyxis]KQZ76378.1 conjugal transfer protein TraA [Sphingopyxis sp. Root154]KRC09734.1 conjugal transfer protein TraA [Sphingopyxis sp. Root214]